MHDYGGRRRWTYQKLGRRQIECLAWAHENEFHVFSAWGTYRRVGFDLEYVGIAKHVATETRDGRLHEHFVVTRQVHGDPDGHFILAACCYFAVERARAKGVKVDWSMVPMVVPSAPVRPEGPTCPRCGCTAKNPCWVEIPGGKGSGACIRPGTFGNDLCGACDGRF